MGNIAIITARGGSKRIPRKNIKSFLGYPIIKYSIEAALKSNCFEEVMVSTDDLEISNISKKYGAKVPFQRSQTTSDDHASTADVLEEVILEYKKTGREFEYMCCIYPTAPFITSEKITDSLRLLEGSDADSLIPVARFSYPIQRALVIRSGKLSMIAPENMNARSQDLPPTYHDIGQFYWLKVNAFLRRKKLLLDNTVAYEIPELEAQDIDNENDWKIAETKYKILNGNLQ